MIKRIFIILIFVLVIVFNRPVYSIDGSPKSLDRYMKKISNKFSRTYCNSTKFGISNDGALAFAIGETNKEFKNNNLNQNIDSLLLKDYIVKSLERNCQVYNFPLNELEKLKFK